MSDWEDGGESRRSYREHMNWVATLDEDGRWCYFLNRMHWAFICAAGGDLRQRKGIPAIKVSEDLKWGLGGMDNWEADESCITRLENGFQDDWRSGEPVLVAQDVIEYATALGVVMDGDVSEFEPTELVTQ